MNKAVAAPEFQELPAKMAEVNCTEAGDDEAEKEEDILLIEYMKQFQEFKEDLALLNHKIEEASEVVELKTLKPVKCDVKKYMPTTIPERISIMSWNIDFHLKYLGKRSVAIADLIEKENHDIILLQEVRAVNFNYFVSRFKDKYVIVHQENKTFYFTATLIKKATIKYESHKTIYFRNTSQGRSILFTKVSIGGSKMDLMNIHLESQGGKELSQIRVAQLKKCIAIASATPGDSNVIVGGDYNIREWEMKQVPLPKRTCDLWVQQGARKDAEYTWDMTVNKNLEFDVPVPPKRFDRLFFKSSYPETLTPKYFGLSGQEKLLGVNEVHNLSDHWALVSKFSLHPSVRHQARSSTAEQPTSSIKVDKDEEDEDKERDDEFVKENWYDDD